MSDFPDDFNHINSESNAETASKIAQPKNFDDVDLSVLFDFEQSPCEGEPDLIVELIDLYLADVPMQLSAIKDSILKTDNVSLKRAAHNLMGSSANLGVKSIARLCEELERIDFIESPQNINDFLDRLEQSFARVRRVFLTERQNRIGTAN